MTPLRHGLRHAAGNLRVLLRAALAVALGTAALALLATLALAWRLNEGPIDLAPLARTIESRLNARTPAARLSLGRLALAWRGYRGGPGHALRLTLDDAALFRPDGTRLAAVAAMEARLAPAPLLLGIVTPTEIAASGLDLTLRHRPGAGLELDLGGLDDPGVTLAGARPADDAPTMDEALAALSRPPAIEDTPAAPALRHLGRLRHVTLSDTTLTLPGARARIARLDLHRRPAGGLDGSAEGTVTTGGAAATLAATAALAPGGATELHATLAPTQAAALQRAVAAPGDLRDLDLPADTLLDAAVAADATLRLDRALRPTAATLRASAGGGTLRLATAAIGFDRLAVDAAATWSAPAWAMPDAVEVTHAAAVVRAPGGTWPSTLTAAASLARGAAGLTGRVTATLDHLAAADIAALWPEPLGGQVRPWLVANVTAGTIRGATLAATVDASDPAHPRLTALDAAAAAEDMTVWWLRPVPPVTGIQASITVRDPATMDIAVAAGRQGAIALRGATVRITGLDVKDQFLAVAADVAAPVPDLVALLRHPRVQILDKRPIPMKDPAGSVTGRVGVNLPLNHDLTFEQVRITAQARATGLHLGGIVAGRDLDRGDVTADLTPEQLRVAGRAALGGIPSDLSVTLDFRGGPPTQVTDQAQVTARVTPAQLATLGLDPAPVFDGGTAAVTARYQRRRDATAEVAVRADLAAATLSVLDWHKPAGTPGLATARVTLRGDALAGIDALHAEAPGMAVDGRVDLVGDRPLLLVLDAATLGQTRAAGRIQFPEQPNQPIRVTLAGATLDLADALSPRAPASTRPGPPWAADIRFDRVLLGKDAALPGVAARAASDGTRLTALDATAAPPASLRATLAREAGGRTLRVTAADAGAVLRALDVTDTVQGGTLALNAAYDDRRTPAPLSGTAELSGFRVLRAPALGKLLQAVTVYGVVEALSGPGLSFRTAVIPFRSEGAVLDLTDVRAFSASLGLTARGRIDQAAGTLDLRGTVVPAYVLNAFLGRIPLLGRLFSAERGGGLVAVDYAMRGPLANPAVSVNPLSALTPGFLRGLFHLFD